MQQPFSYLTVEDVVQLHDRVVERVGGRLGVLDWGAVSSCVAQPQSGAFEFERYPGVYEKAAAYCYYIVKNHPFSDGNKRTGFLAGLMFLITNGVIPTIDQDEMYAAIHGVASGEAGFDVLVQAFRGRSS